MKGIIRSGAKAFGLMSALVRVETPVLVFYPLGHLKWKDYVAYKANIFALARY
jgi:hypothetical protein